MGQRPVGAEADRWAPRRSGVLTVPARRDPSRLRLDRVAQGVRLARDHGKLDEAVALYRKALDINPNCVDALVARGAAYGTQKKDSLALKDLQRALELDPVHPNARKYYDVIAARQPPTVPAPATTPTQSAAPAASATPAVAPRPALAARPEYDLVPEWEVPALVADEKAAKKHHRKHKHDRDHSKAAKKHKKKKGKKRRRSSSSSSSSSSVSTTTDDDGRSRRRSRHQSRSRSRSRSGSGSRRRRGHRDGERRRSGSTKGRRSRSPHDGDADAAEWHSGRGGELRRSAFE